MLTEMLDKINKYLEERKEKKYQKLQRELEEEYGDPDEVPESTYEEVENTDEINMNIQEPVEEEINMNIQEPTEEEIDMNVVPKKKKSIRSIFQNLKKTKKETTPVNEEINMNIQEPTEEEIDMNVIPKKKKGIRGFFQNLKRNKKETTPVNEEINMNIQEPTQEEIDMNVIPKKKKGIRSFFQNLKETKKETTPVNEEINMNIQEPTQEEIDMNVMPKKKKGIRGFFQNLKAKVMKKSNSELKESTTKMDIANATLFTIIQGIILTGTIVVGVMNPAVGFLAGILASVCTLAVIADIKDAIVKYIEYKNEEKIEENQAEINMEENQEEVNVKENQAEINIEENQEEVNVKENQAEINIEEKTENSLEPTISYFFTMDGLKIAKVDLTNIHTDPGLYINQELFGFKNETADAKQFVVNRKDEAVNHYVASEIENVTGMKPIYMDCPIKGNEKRVYILTKMFKR